MRAQESVGAQSREAPPDEPALSFVTLGRVLACFAHPDDAELTCFGTLARWASTGAEITVSCLTDGAGTSGRFPDQRRAHAASAAALIGANARFAHLEDGNVVFGSEALKAVDALIAEVRPEVVITHHRDPDGFGHQDHSATSDCVTNAALRAQSVRWILHAEPPTASTTFRPNVFVDITSHFATKLQAARMYAGESDKEYFGPEFIEARASWWALQAGTRIDAARKFEAFEIIRGVVGPA